MTLDIVPTTLTSRSTVNIGGQARRNRRKPRSFDRGSATMIPRMGATRYNSGQKAEMEPRIAAMTAANDTGFVNPNENQGDKQKSDSVGDLKKHLGNDVQLVDSATAADVVIEVRGRGGESTGDATTTHDVFGAHTRADYSAAVHVQLRAGDYKMDIAGYAPPEARFGVWSYAAGRVANQVKQWIAANHDKLIALRTK